MHRISDVPWRASPKCKGFGDYEPNAVDPTNIGTICAHVGEDFPNARIVSRPLRDRFLWTKEITGQYVGNEVCKATTDYLKAYKSRSICAVGSIGAQPQPYETVLVNGTVQE